LNLASGPVKFWDTIRKFKNSHYFKENENFNSNKQLDINSYISKLAPIGVIPKMPKCVENEVLNYFKFGLKLEELKETITIVTIKSDSSPGPDLINNYLLKLIPDVGQTIGDFRRHIERKIFSEHMEKIHHYTFTKIF